MPAAAYKSSAATTGTGFSITGTMGAAAQFDTKVIVVFARATATGLTLSSPPVGYTERQAWTYWADGESYYAVYSKAVTGTESSESVSFTLGTSATWGLQCIVVTGDWDAISPEANSRIGFGTTATAPSVTTTTTNTVILNSLLAVLWRAFAPPAGITEVIDVRDSSLSLSMALGHGTATAAGATGTYAWGFRDPDNTATPLGSAGRAVTFAIKANGTSSVTVSGGGEIPVSTFGGRPPVLRNRRRK